MIVMPKDYHYVIAGGGISGLFAADALVSLGAKHITIVEKSAELGGLLRSSRNQNPLDSELDFTFDYGTHFILKTGDEKIDAILDQTISCSDYIEYKDSLPEGQYINGQLYTDSAARMLFISMK